jgi:hypothetical protein
VEAPRGVPRGAFGRQRKEKPPKGAKSVAYEFRHIRAKAAPNAIPAMPTLAEALGC